MTHTTRRLLRLTPMLFLALAACGLWDLQRQVGELKGLPEEAANAFEAVDGRLIQLEAQLFEARAQLERAERRGASNLIRNGRVDRLEARVLNAQEDLALHGELFEEWKGRHQEQVAQGLALRLETLTHRATERWDGLQGQLRSALELTALNRERLAKLDIQRARRPQVMWRDLIGPTVQLAGETTVGTGVLLAPTRNGEDGPWKTPVITAWHVVRDILQDARDDDPSIPISIYSADGSVRHETGLLLGFDRWVDVALLEMTTDEPCEHWARLASRERLAAITTFNTVYAVGCPLGNDPIPTYGEIADRRHTVDGELYWMISAPTYIGNSGGGIFDAETHELLAIFSKIYTHGSLQPTVVPHMGLATPLDIIYDWLEEEGLAWIEPSREQTSPLTAAASLEAPLERD